MIKRFQVFVLSALLIVTGAGLDRLASPPISHAQATFAPFVCTNSVPVSSASSVQVVTAANANMFIYVCAISLGSIGGSSFSVVEGTGTTCATGITAVSGGTTAATGYGIAANGSPVQGGGGVGYILKTKTAGDNLCLIVAGTGPLAGSLTVAQQNQ